MQIKDIDLILVLDEKSGSTNQHCPKTSSHLYISEVYTSWSEPWFESVYAALQTPSESSSLSEVKILREGALKQEKQSA